MVNIIYPDFWKPTSLGVANDITVSGIGANVETRYNTWLYSTVPNTNLTYAAILNKLTGNGLLPNGYYSVSDMTRIINWVVSNYPEVVGLPTLADVHASLQFGVPITDLSPQMAPAPAQIDPLNGALINQEAPAVVIASNIEGTKTDLVYSPENILTDFTLPSILDLPIGLLIDTAEKGNMDFKLEESNIPQVIDSEFPAYTINQTNLASDISGAVNLGTEKQTIAPKLSLDDNRVKLGLLFALGTIALIFIWKKK